jgi:flagellar biosynthesis protein FlhG
VTSGKGGVGKSSFALNFAIALSRRGKKVLVVDMDFGLANIDVMLGVTTKYDLLNVVRDHRDIRELIEVGLEGVRFISGGSGMYELVKLNAPQLTRIMNNLFHLGDIVDTIIFDTGAGISDNILRLICASHETILIATPEPTSVMDAYAMVKIVSRQDVNANVLLVINKADTEKEAHAAMDGFIRIAQKYTNMSIKEFGYILRDNNMVKAVKQQVPILVSYPKCTASMNIEQLTDKYLMTPQPEKLSFAGFFERLLNKNYKVPE